jgi:hypothetical protein
VGQIGTPAPELVHVERSIRNAPPPQKEHIRAQSSRHGQPKRGNMISSSLACMHIQFRTLTFHSRLEEQLQERLRLKKSTTSLSVAIGELGYPLGPHPESELTTNIYFGSTAIANLDESDRWISFNLLNKFTISLSAAIGASDSPLGPYPERDLAINLCFGSIPIAIKDESNHRIRFRQLQEIYNITTRGDQCIWHSSRNPSKNRSRYKSML